MRPIALVVLLPLAAFAQSSTPEPSAAPAVAPPAATARPDWSLGAGVGFETGLFASSPTYVLSSSSGLYLSAPSIPSAIASLERRLSARDWLVLGASGSYMHDRQDLRPQSTGVTKSDRSGLAISAGVRHVLTPAGAPVAVSFDALANLGATRWEGDVSFYDYAAVEKRVRANQGKRKEADADTPSRKPLSAEDEAWLAKEDVRRALAIIRESASKAPEKLRPDDNLELDLGLDSMQRVELLVALEQQLGGDVEESQLAEIYTVRQLVDGVLESAASGKVPTTRREQFAGWKAVLAEEPDDPQVLEVAAPWPVIDTLLYFFTRMVQVIARDRFHLQVTGLEKLPATGPYILSSNHQGYLDPVILASVLPEKVFRRLFAVGTSDIFGSGFMRKLARFIRVVVVDPDVNLIPAMRAGAYGLRHGRILILYPEGERSIDGTPKVFKKGAAILSIHLQAPIVPVAIDGFYEAWPRGKKFFQKFSRLKMTFGDPIVPPPESAASEQSYEQLTATLRARVVQMWDDLRDGNAAEEHDADTPAAAD